MLGATTSFHTIGTVPIRAYINKHTFEFDFLVLDDPSINIPFDGLIGDDILQPTRAIIDYDNYVLKFKAWENELPLFKEHTLAPRSRSILTIDTQPTELKEGIIEVDTTDNKTLIVPGLNSISHNKTQIVAINTSFQPKHIILPSAVVSQPIQILTIEHQKTKDQLQTLCDTIKLDHLAPTEQKQLLQLIESHAEIFLIKGDQLQSNVQHYHEICLKDNSLPIHVRNYRFLEIQESEVESQMEDLLKQGIIQPSKSPWNTQDDLTKFVILQPTPTTETGIVGKHLIHIICQYGIPEHIRTDQGTAFCSNLIQEITDKLGIKKLKCSPYHPESNGALERSHGSIKETIRFQINTDRNDWDEFIDVTAYSYNTAIHTATGSSPFELLFGVKPRLPYLQPETPTQTYESYATDTKQRLHELCQKAIETQIADKEKSKKRYDQKNNAQFAFAPGDKVKLKTRNIQGKRGALSKPYEGPFDVVSTNYPNVTIALDGKEKTFHANFPIDNFRAIPQRF
jgi:hypothetical protein